MKKKITIGLFNDTFFPMVDGVAVVVDNYAKRLSQYANVVVFVPEYKGSQEFDKKAPYKIVRCNSIHVPGLDYSLATPKLDYKFEKELNSYNLDIVHIHSPFTIGKLGIEYAKKNNIPCVATMHSQFKRDFLRAVKNEWLSDMLTDQLIKQFNKCDECWAVNDGIAKIYYNDYKYKCMPEIKSNATEMLPVEDEKEARGYINKKYNINDDDLVFLFVGRINILKNILFIVESLKIIKDKKPNLKFKMLFVGDGNDIDKLKEHIDKFDLKDNCILCGKITDRSELAKYYSRADLFLFPSLYDASSLVQIEAASQKTPALFIEGAATASNIKNNVNGFLSKNNVLAYADKIIEIVDNKKKLKEVSTNSYKQLYRTWDEVVLNAYNRYVEMIEDR